MQGSFVVILQQFCSALHTLLMMTAESMLSKRPVLRLIVALHFLVKDELHVINYRVLVRIKLFVLGACYYLIIQVAHQFTHMFVFK